jgi:hypothetical protein
MAEKIYLKEHLQEILRQKYAPKSKIGADNTIIHKIFNYIDEDEAKEIVASSGIVFNPNLLLMQEEFDLLATYKYRPQIGPGEPLLYDYMSSEGLPFVAQKAGLGWATKELPYASRELKRKFEEIKKKNFDLVVVGYGGAMSNVLWNLFLLANTFEVFSLFNRIIIFEKDELSFSNILRFGKPVIHRAFSNLEVEEDVINKPLLLTQEYRLSSTSVTVYKEFLTKNNVKKIMELDNPLIIGAPNFETRALLQEVDAPFLFIGHGNNEVTLTHKPNIHFAVQETYGTIDVPVLLVNLWLATYAFVASLAENDPQSFTQNQELFKFNFDELSEEEVNKAKAAFTRIVD